MHMLVLAGRLTCNCLLQAEFFDTHYGGAGTHYACRVHQKTY